MPQYSFEDKYPPIKAIDTSKPHKILKVRGTNILVDSDVFDVVSKWNWRIKDGYVLRRFYMGYDKTTDRRLSKTVPLHRYIARPSGSLVVDHINGDKNNNTLENLRVCTKAQNAANRKVSRNSKTGVKGVWYDKTMSRKKRWIASIHHNGRTVRIGRFLTIEEASKKYDEYATRLKGEYARLNTGVRRIAS